MWVEYGTGNCLRAIPVHQIVQVLGPAKCQGLPMFHALTGCDTTSAFCSIGKKTAWSAWKVFPSITEVFKKLSCKFDEILESDVQQLECFVVCMYDKTLEVKNVNDARQILFSSGTRTLERIPPTSAALFQHIKRSAYQAGLVWGQSLTTNQQLPSPSLYGWKRENEHSNWQIHWTDLADASLACRELIKCGCKKKCSGKCKCKKAELECTPLCACHGKYICS